MDVHDCLFGQADNTALCHKNKQNLHLVRHVFTKILQFCVSHQYTHFDVLTCQMWMQVMQFFAFFGNFDDYQCQTFRDYEFNQCTHSDIDFSLIRYIFINLS